MISDEPVALVTGAARGIGAATVRALHRDGFRVMAVDACSGSDHGMAEARYAMAHRHELESLAEELGDRVTMHVADVRHPVELYRAVDHTLARWGRLDAAVAAAAVMAGGEPLWSPAAHRQLEALWRVDVEGVWNTAAATVPAILAGPDPRRGRFVALASTAGGRGLFRLAAYCTVKHAVVGLIRGLAADLAGTGVCAMAVCPGATRTAMLQATAAIYDIPEDHLASSSLVGEVLDPDEIAATIAFCCSRPARALNGSVITADGGAA
ncbi:MAG: SDR family oxidoreductase [Kineosporiaceae bacterium]|nr:SDR family oxidoreductase [Kineosporiaceae bacterium]MBK7622632.1 SDR family oxidoreductase [Kineosporiaceae bacterium]MBK8078613.1 SDR family oxidoreductase [Kineosporiaceae bacterium]